MNVYMFSFQKKANSTKQPTLTDGTQFSNIQLKDETSVLNPVLTFNHVNWGTHTPTNRVPNPFTPSYWNYVYIVEFARYYFIDDWKYINGLWECSCSVDVLASFKTAIGTQSAYIERSASASNGDLIDKLYPTKTNVQITSATIATSWANVAPSGGCYIIGMVDNQTTNHIGAISYYALDTAGLNALLTYLFSNNIFVASNITEIGEGLFKSLFNPFQYIVSCMWLPGATSHYGSTSTTVKCGYWDTGVSAVLVNALADVRFITGTIPDHPQISRGAYLNYAPYTKITLFCPPFGEVPIDTSFLNTGKLLYSKVIVDPITGQATLRVAFRQNGTDPFSAKSCFEKTAMFGVPIQLAQVLSDYTNSIQTAMSGISGGLAGIAAGAIGATVMSAVESQTPKVSSNGANGSFINFALDPELVVEHMLLADEDNTDHGRPLMSTRTISSLSGYIKCVESHFDGACMNSEKDMINNFLVSGFYYE